MSCSFAVLQKFFLLIISSLKTIAITLDFLISAISSVGEVVNAFGSSEYAETDVVFLQHMRKLEVTT